MPTFKKNQRNQCCPTRCRPTKTCTNRSCKRHCNSQDLGNRDLLSAKFLTWQGWGGCSDNVSAELECHFVNPLSEKTNGLKLDHKDGLKSCKTTAPHPPIILLTLLRFAVQWGVHLGLHSFCYRSELLQVCLEQSPVVVFHSLSGSTTILK